MNSLPKTVTRQRCDCDLNRGPSAPESSTLTTRLPSHPYTYNTNLQLLLDARLRACLHEVPDEVLGDVLEPGRFAPLEPRLLVDPHLGGAATARAVLEFAVRRSEQRLVDAGPRGQGEVATPAGSTRHRADPVRALLTLRRRRRRPSTTLRVHTDGRTPAGV